MCRTPWVRSLERFVEVEHISEIVPRVTGLAHQQTSVDEGKHDVSQMRGRADSPMIQHQAGEDAKSFQREFAYGMRQFATVDVASLGHPRLKEFKRRQHEQERAFIEPRFPQADLLH